MSKNRVYSFKTSMKKIILALLFIFILTPQVFAETNVNVSQNTGKSTVCINGECTTDDSDNSRVKVCVDDKCYESDGDLEVNEGDSHVSIKNTNGTNSISVNSSSNSKTSVKVKTINDDEKEEKDSQDVEEDEEGEDAKEDEKTTTIFERIAKIFKNLFPIFKF